MGAKTGGPGKKVLTAVREQGTMPPLDQTAHYGGQGQMNSRRATAGRSWFWLLVLCAAGCSRATAVIPPQPLDAYQFQETRGGVGIGVDPYFTTERIRRTFRGGESFAESGVLPVRVAVHNGGGAEITVNPRDFRLVRPSSRGEAPVSAYDAFSMVRLQPGWWVAIPILGDSAVAARNEPRLKDLETRALRETTVPPGGSTTGFIYFGIPEDQKNLAGSRVVVVVKTASGRDLAYEIPIAGRRDIPVPSTAPQAGGGDPRPTPAPERGGSGATTPSGPVRIEGTGGGVIIRSPAQ